MRLLCGLFCAVALVVAAPASAVLDGTADGNVHPYVGAFNDGVHFCSGFLVSATVAVTAGHCFADGSTIRATFASEVPQDPNDPAIVTGVAHVDPSYCCGIDNPVTHDVAVVVLDEPQPGPYASLPALGAADRLDKQAALTAVGYGVNGFARGGGQPQPVFTGVRTTATIEVGNAGKKLSDEFLKLASNGSGNKPGLCFGDSGSPQLLPGTSTALSLGSFGMNAICSGHTYVFRLDTPEAQEFINQFS